MTQVDHAKEGLRLAIIARDYARTYICDLIQRTYEVRKNTGGRPTSSEIDKALERLEETIITAYIAAFDVTTAEMLESNTPRVGQRLEPLGMGPLHPPQTSDAGADIPDER